MNEDVITFRDQAVEGFLKYQTLKFDRSKIVPLQEEYKSLSFKEDGCYIGEIKLEETSYICDATLPNFIVQNVVIEAEQILQGSEFQWRIVLKVNFFGLCLCVYHTKQQHSYYLGIPNFFDPSFKIIAKEDDPGIKRKDNMICTY